MSVRNRFFSFIVASAVAFLGAACGADRASSPGGPTDLAGSDDGSASTLASGEGSGGSGSGGSGSGGSGGGGGDAIRVRCRLEGTSRSKISVDGRNLAAGNYRARVTSGTNTALSGAMRTVGDEVEFDFDSNANDIAEGATPIAASFIQGGTVTGEVLLGSAIVTTATATCRVRR
jgi:hypothetical protein